MRNIRSPFRPLVGTALAAALTFSIGATAQAEDGHRDTAEKTARFHATQSEDGRTEYCTRIPPSTGTLLPRKICKTAEEWERVGVHIDTK